MTIGEMDRKDLLHIIQAKKQEMGVLQEQIIQMSRAYNSTSSASALPPEILFLIFWEYLRRPTLKTARTDPWVAMTSPEETEDPYESKDPDNPSEEGPPHERWLVLAGVCHTWRTVLFSSPLLWSRIEASIFRHLDLLEKFISISRRAPLDVFITGASPLDFVREADNLSKSLIRIFDEGTRLKSLHLTFHLPAFQYLLLAYRFRYSFSHLQSLDILLDLNEMEDTYVPKPVLGFPTFMDMNFQSLRHVALTNVYTEWKSLFKLPPTITDLSITNELQPLLVGPMDDVHVVLKKLVDLKKLALYDCLPPSTGRLTGSIHLSKLEKLTIAGESTRVMTLFDSLEHPPSTEICVGLEVHSGQNISVASSSVLSRIHRMYEGWSEGVGASICAENGHVSVSLSPDKIRQSLLFLKLAGNRDDARSFSPLNLLCNALEAASAKLLSPVTSLWLALLDRPTHDATGLLRLILQILKDVTSITIEGQVTHLTEALRPQQDKPVPLPELWRLCLAETKIVEGIGAQPCGSLSADTLCGCLEERQNRNCGIEWLELDDDCEVHLSTSDELRGRLRGAVEIIYGWEEQSAEDESEDDDDDDDGDDDEDDKEGDEEGES